MSYLNLTIADCLIQLSEDAAKSIWVPPFTEYLSSVSEVRSKAPALSVEADDISAAVSRLGLSVSTGGLPLMGLLGETLPLYRKLLFHGAVVSFKGKAYVFTAPSGTGKSTHIKLWKTYLGDSVTVICGDKPIISVPEEPDSKVSVFGSPWGGKEGWQTNSSAIMGGLCFIGRSNENTIRSVLPSVAINRTINQAYIPKDPHALGLTLDMIDALLKRVPLFELSCDMSRSAVQTSFETMTHYSFNEFAV